ncbi:MFS transporter [Miltoncostaea marina]|uniref:MFS transporter n=1 Tax=Miltoncostaea marina TaxID=2843215 RepID=UPI001C3E1FBF|nr:MFS transporter [Miltoncostaea marina]
MRELLDADDATEGSACEDIPEEACHDAPGNFALNVANGASTKCAELIASPSVVLPLLLTTVGAPIGLVGALEPVRRGASLVPGLIVSGRMRAFGRRKGFWVAAGLVQAATLLVSAVVAATLSGSAAGVVLVAMLALFSLASGAGSVAFGDVMGTTIPRRRRGRLLGLRAAIGGLIGVVVGGVLAATLGPQPARGTFVALLIGSAALWVLGAWLFSLIREPAGPVAGGRTPLAEARAGVALLRRVAGFRRFLLARGLLAATEVAVPFYVLAAREAGVDASGLGAFLVASGVAAVAGNPVWGWATDHASDRAVMTVAGMIGTLAAVLAVALMLADAGGELAYAGVVFVAVVAQEGVRLGRKAYLVTAAPPRERPLYVALANTIIGVLMIAFALLGVLAQAAGVAAAVGAVLALSVLGVAATRWTPEPEEMARAHAGTP